MTRLVDENGQMIGGEYHSGFTGVGTITCTFAADGNEAIGSTPCQDPVRRAR